MPRRLNTPWGTVSVPDDATDEQIDQFISQLDAENNPASQPQQVSADEPDSYWGGFAKGALQGVREGIQNVKGFAQKVHPVAAGVADAVIPDFVQEVRAPNYQDAQRILPGVAGAAVGIPMALSGVGLGAAVPAAMAATGATSKALGNNNWQVAKDVAIEGVAGAIPGLAPVASRLGRSMVRGGFGLHGATAETAPIVETAIREGINATTGGLRKTEGLIGRLNNEVRRTLEGINGQTVDLNTGVRNMEKLAAEMERLKAPAPDIAAVRAVIDDLGARSGAVSPIAAHEIKVAGQERLARTYASDAPAAARKQAEQAYIQGTREGIEDAATKAGVGEAVGPVNARVGQLREVESILRRGTAPRVTGGDIASTAAFGPKFAAARVGFRPGVQTSLGRKIAVAGDTVEAITGFGKARAAKLAKPAERAEAQHGSKLAANVFEDMKANAAKAKAKAAKEAAYRESALPVERPDAVAGPGDLKGSTDVGLDQLGIPAVGQPANTDDLWAASARVARDDQGRPVMPPRARPTSMDELGIDETPGQWPAAEFQPDALDRAGVPVERPGTPGLTWEEVAWQNYQDELREGARRASQAKAQAGVAQSYQPVPPMEPRQLSLGESDMGLRGGLEVERMNELVRQGDRVGPIQGTLQSLDPTDPLPIRRQGEVQLPQDWRKPDQILPGQATVDRYLQPRAGTPTPAAPAPAGQAEFLADQTTLPQAQSPHSITIDDVVPEGQVISYEQQLDEGGPIANSSGVTDVSREAVNAAQNWEYFAVKPGGRPRPLIGIRAEDATLNPGERLARRPKGTSDRLSLY